MSSENRSFFQSNASGWGLTEAVVGLCCLIPAFTTNGIVVTMLLIVIGVSLVGHGVLSIYKNSY